MKRRSILTMNDKRAVSAMVGYVLVVTFGIIMSAIVYNYLKTYVPKDAIKCPAGTSIFLKDFGYDPATGKLDLVLKNNGKFNLAGYYIYGANDVNQKVATDNLVNMFEGSLDGFAVKRENQYIMFSGTGNDYMKPHIEPVTHTFNIGVNSPLQVIEITPVRFEKIGETVRFASCGDATIRQELI